MSKNNEKIQPEIKDNDIDNETQANMLNFKINKLEFKQPNNNENVIIENKDTKLNKETMIDKSMINLKAINQNNEIINNLNSNDKSEKKMTKKNLSFMQKTKTWIGKTWTNIKNYDYSKFNIFKKEEMEECLDAHGNPIKIPKKKHKTIPNKENQNQNQINLFTLDNNYYKANMNILSGYPF